MACLNGFLKLLPHCTGRYISHSILAASILPWCNQWLHPQLGVFLRSNRKLLQKIWGWYKYTPRSLKRPAQGKTRNVWIKLGHNKFHYELLSQDMMRGMHPPHIFQCYADLGSFKRVRQMRFKNKLSVSRIASKDLILAPRLQKSKSISSIELLKSSASALWWVHYQLVMQPTLWHSNSTRPVQNYQKHGFCFNKLEDVFWRIYNVLITCKESWFSPDL